MVIKMADIKKTIFAAVIPLMAAFPSDAKADSLRLSYTIGDNSRIHFSYIDPRPERVVIVRERPHVVKKVIIKEARRRDKHKHKVVIAPARDFKHKHYSKTKYVSKSQHRRMHRHNVYHVHRDRDLRSEHFKGGYVYLYK